MRTMSCAKRQERLAFWCRLMIAVDVICAMIAVEILGQLLGWW